MNSRTLGATLTAMVLITAPVACSSTASNQISASTPNAAGPTTPSSSPTIGVGQTTEFASQFTGEQGTTIRLTVSKVAYITSFTDIVGIDKPTRGLYARVTMTATNVGTHPGLFDSANFVWVSPQGQAIPDTGALGAAADNVPTVAMQPGQHVSGIASYDVSAKGGELQYEIANDQPPLVTVVLPSS